MTAGLVFFSSQRASGMGRVSVRVLPPRKRTWAVIVSARVTVTSSIKNRIMRFRSRGWCLRIAPQPREIGGQCQHASPLLVGQRRSIRGVLAFAALLCVVEGAQLRIPVRFEPVGHEAVVGVDVHEPLTCEVGFVLRTLHLHRPQPTRLRQV